MGLYCHNCQRRVRLMHTSCPVCRNRLIWWYINAALIIISILVVAGFFV